jgi:hypothetical protein
LFDCSIDSLFASLFGRWLLGWLVGHWLVSGWLAGSLAILPFVSRCIFNSAQWSLLTVTAFRFAGTVEVIRVVVAVVVVVLVMVLVVCGGGYSTLKLQTHYIFRLPGGCFAILT